jgi:hypothetical protein
MKSSQNLQFISETLEAYSVPNLEPNGAKLGMDKQFGPKIKKNDKSTR